MTRRRIAILGGGPSGLATAWWLTNRPEDRERFEVTVYERSWRLGGKGASGRDPATGRIEEHGIHLFGNWYQNTWELLRRTHAELGADDPAVALARDFDDQTSVAVLQPAGGGAWEWATRVPAAVDGVPWRRDDGDDPSTSMDQQREALFGSAGQALTGPGMQVLEPAEWPEMRSAVPGAGKADLGAPPEALPDEDAGIEVLQQRATRAAVSTAEAVVDALPGKAAAWRGDNLSLFEAILRGLHEDDVEGRGLAAFDDVDHVTWLARHLDEGDVAEVLDGPLSRVIPNICFHGVDTSDPDDRHSELSAGAYLSFALRELGYRGAVGYFFRSSTGETVMRPLFDVLRQRGVRFRFFHHVDALRTDGDRVTAIEMKVLARPFACDADTPDDERYEPLVERPVRSGSARVWPNAPLLDRTTPFADGVDLSHWAAAADCDDVVTLRAGEDFDEVVLATSVAPLHHVAADLLDADPPLRAAADGLRTTPTKHAQLWLADRPAGWVPMADGERRWFGVTFTPQWPAFVSLHELLDEEDWSRLPGPRRPRDVLWLSAALPPAPDEGPVAPIPTVREQRAARRRVLRALEAVIEPLRMAGVPPAFVDAKGWSAPRVDDQYWRANIDPDERYVLSAPGTMRHRPSAWDSHLGNLTYAGDWTDTGINIGCFEAAVTSGMLAAYAINAHPRLEDVRGFWFLRGERWRAEIAGRVPHAPTW